MDDPMIRPRLGRIKGTRLKGQMVPSICPYITYPLLPVLPFLYQALLRDRCDGNGSPCVVSPPQPRGNLSAIG
jgi:hypothetical protein